MNVMISGAAKKGLGATALKEQSGKYIYSLCCRELSEKIDAALMSVQRE